MMEQRPASVRRMENGKLGESRARSFLMDRFWTLERSVDIQGADLIFMRRVTLQNLLDPDPPRFGIVQSKFYESNKTKQYIRKDYLQDGNEMPLSELFIMCFTGIEEKQRIAFLTSRDVIGNFREMTGGHNKAGSYELPWKAVFDVKYVVTSPRIVLDRMERALENAELISNRKFVLRKLSGVGINPHTDPTYEIPLDNPYGSIPDKFKELKLIANSAMFSVQDLHDVLHRIVATSNPEVALKAVRDVHRNYGEVQCAYADFNSHLDDAVIYHKELCEPLMRLGLLDAYVDLQEEVTTAVVKAALAELIPPKGKTRVLSVLYEPATLKALSIEIRMDNADGFAGIPNREDVSSSRPGEIVVFSQREFFRKHRLGKVVELSPEEHAQECAWILRRPLMEEVCRHLTGKYYWE